MKIGKYKFRDVLRYKKPSGLQEFEDAMSRIEEIHLQYHNSTHTSILEIPNDRYVELRYNIFARQVLSPEDILFDYEMCASNTVKNIDFDNNVVLAVKFDEGEGFPAHTHNVQETLRCVKGSYKDEVANIVYTEGDTQEVKPLQLHSFMPLERGFAIVELYKQN